MAQESVGSGRPPDAHAASVAGARVIERAQRSVARVRREGRGVGAGVVWDRDLVLTNHHVVAGRRDEKARVTPRDGRSFDAGVARRDRGLDLTLLRVLDRTGDLPVAPVGDSDGLRVGEPVHAIGHPRGRPGAVTAGVVSDFGRTRGPGGSVRYVGSDEALAPGNSGGPLPNAKGEVVGINAMVSGRLGLSIPSNAVSIWATGSEERRPRLGVGVRPVALRGERAGETGLIVVAVESGGPAHRAGLMVGDAPLGADGRTVEDAGSLLDTLSSAGASAGANAGANAGDSVSLRVMRGGEVSSVDVGLGALRPGRAA